MFGIKHGFAGLGSKCFSDPGKEAVGLKPPHFKHSFGISGFVGGMHRGAFFPIVF